MVSCGKQRSCRLRIATESFKRRVVMLAGKQKEAVLAARNDSQDLNLNMRGKTEIKSSVMENNCGFSSMT